MNFKSKRSPMFKYLRIHLGLAPLQRSLALCKIGLFIIFATDMSYRKVSISINPGSFSLPINGYPLWTIKHAFGNNIFHFQQGQGRGGWLGSLRFIYEPINLDSKSTKCACNILQNGSVRYGASSGLPGWKANMAPLRPS